MPAGSVWAMSGTSGEAIAAVVRQVLSVRGPMAEDDLLGALDADGIDLGPDPDVMLADVLDQDAELVMPLADERWAWIPALLGRTPNRSSSAIGPRTERTCRTTAASASPELPDIAQTLPARTGRS